jgi:hypothetical protein
MFPHQRHPAYTQPTAFNNIPLSNQQLYTLSSTADESSPTTDLYDPAYHSQLTSPPASFHSVYSNSAHLSNSPATNPEQSRYNEFPTSLQRGLGTNVSTPPTHPREREDRRRESSAIEPMISIGSLAVPPSNTSNVQYNGPFGHDQSLRSPTNVSNLKSRERASSSKQKRYVCFNCAKPYDSSATLQNHLRITHLEHGLLHGGTDRPDSTITLWACGLCTAIPPFDSSDLLLNHLADDHGQRKVEFCGWDLSKVMHNLLCHKDLNETYQTMLLRELLADVYAPVWDKSSDTMAILRSLQSGAFTGRRALVNRQALVERALMHATIRHRYLSSTRESSFPTLHSQLDPLTDGSALASNTSMTMHTIPVTNQPFWEDGVQEPGLSSGDWPTQQMTSAQVSDTDSRNSYNQNPLLSQREEDRTSRTPRASLYGSGLVSYGQTSPRRSNNARHGAEPGDYRRQGYSNETEYDV